MKLPDLVGEYIDQNVLPELADGYATAEIIYEIVLDRVKGVVFLIEDFGAEAYAAHHDNQQLIDCYWNTPHNKQTIIDYIEKAWESWEVSE